MFDTNGVRPNPDKVKAILESPIPSNVSNCKLFLVSVIFTNASFKISVKFSLLCIPPYCRKMSNFTEDSKQNDSFNAIKSLFVDHKIFKLFCPTFETLLEIDSSCYGIAAVLMQRKDDRCDCMAPSGICFS